MENSNKKNGFDFGERGPKEREMDRETTIVLLRSCGYPVPMTPEEWKEYAKKLASFLENLDVNQRNSVVRPARRVASDRIRIAEEGITIDEKKLNSVNEYIPLSESKDRNLDVFADYNDMTEEQKRLIIEAIQMGLAGQQKAIQHLEKSETDKGIEL